MLMRAREKGVRGGGGGVGLVLLLARETASSQIRFQICHLRGLFSSVHTS